MRTLPRVEFFEQLFERSNRNLEVFYRLVEELEGLPREDWERSLQMSSQDG